MLSRKCKVCLFGFSHCFYPEVCSWILCVLVSRLHLNVWTGSALLVSLQAGLKTCTGSWGGPRGEAEMQLAGFSESNGWTDGQQALGARCQRLVLLYPRPWTRGTGSAQCLHLTQTRRGRRGLERMRLQTRQRSLQLLYCVSDLNFG